jgi:hypothetical protein
MRRRQRPRKKGRVHPEGKNCHRKKTPSDPPHRIPPMPRAENSPRPPALRAYRRKQGWLAAALAAQLLGGLAVLPKPAHEVFPLFSWFLFALTPPAERTLPELRVAELGGKKFDPPAPLETERTLITPVQAPAVVRLAKDMGAALAAGDMAALRRARRTLEENYLREPGRYTLVETAYDPVARLHGAAARERVVREFTIGEP